jgi:uncharacterized protein
VRFRRNAPLDPGQVTDVRGRGVGPGGIAVGGGGLGIVGLVVYLLIALFSGGGNALGQLAPLDGQQVGQGDTPADVNSECRTGQDANRRQDCRIVAVVNSVQKFWDGVFQRNNRQYQYVDTVFFSQGQVNPETWTHGSSEQRRRWFSQGYENRRPAVCDTFSGSI